MCRSGAAASLAVAVAAVLSCATGSAIGPASEPGPLLWQSEQCVGQGGDVAGVCDVQAEAAWQSGSGQSLLQEKASASGHSRFVGSSFKQLRAVMHLGGAGAPSRGPALEPATVDVAGVGASSFDVHRRQDSAPQKKAGSAHPALGGLHSDVLAEQLEVAHDQREFVSLLGVRTRTSRARFFLTTSLGCAAVVGLSWYFRHSLEKYVLPGLPHCITWVCCASLMIMCVKWLLDSESGNFPYPLTLSTWHLTACTLVASAVRWLSPRRVRSVLMPAIGDSGSDLPLLRSVLPAVLVIGVLHASQMSMGIYSYMIASVTLLQMVQVFVGPVAACLSSFAVGTEEASCELLGIMSVISVGALLMVHKEASVVPFAILLQAASTALDNLRLQGVQVLVQGGTFHSRLDAMTALYLCSPVSLVCMAFVAATMEWSAGGSQILERAYELRWPLLLDGVAAVAVSIAAVAAVERAKALTVGIFAVLKDCFLMWCDAMAFGTHIMPTQAVGLGVATLGVGLYKRYRTGAGPKCLLEPALQPAALPGEDAAAPADAGAAAKADRCPTSSPDDAKMGTS